MSENKHWTENITPHWHPPEGFFNGSAESIAEGLKDDSVSLTQALDRICFYINRVGENLSEGDKIRLEKAKEILRKMYE